MEDHGLQYGKVTSVLPGDIAIQLKNLLRLIHSKEPMEVSMPFVLWIKSEESSDPDELKVCVMPMMFIDVTDIHHWEKLKEYLEFTVKSIDKQIEKLKV